MYASLYDLVVYPYVDTNTSPLPTGSLPLTNPDIGISQVVLKFWS